jgi:heme/copper-type cytochrome/quinol oxidase subunit 2
VLSPQSRKTADFRVRQIYHLLIGIIGWLTVCAYVVFIYFTIIYREEWGTYNFRSVKPKHNTILVYWFRIEILLFPFFAVYGVLVSHLYMRIRRKLSFKQFV